MDLNNLEITHNKNQMKFHVYIDEEECYLKYRQKTPTVLEYFMVYVPPLLRGRDIASRLTEEALNFARANEFLVAPTCSFVWAYIERRHQDYKNIVAKGFLFSAINHS